MDEKYMSFHNEEDPYIVLPPPSRTAWHNIQVKVPQPVLKGESSWNCALQPKLALKELKVLSLYQLSPTVN